jgi:hypothetical protein
VRFRGRRSRKGVGHDPLSSPRDRDAEAATPSPPPPSPPPPPTAAPKTTA